MDLNILSGQSNYRIYLYFDAAIIGKQLLANPLQFHIQVIYDLWQDEWKL